MPRTLRISALIAILILSSVPALAASSAEVWQESLRDARKARTSQDWERANRSFELALREAESFAEGDTRLVRTLEELAGVYAQQRDRRALELQERAIELRSGQEDGVRKGLGESLHKLGKLYRDFGMTAEAESAMRGSLEVLSSPEANQRSLRTLLRDLADMVIKARPDDAEPEQWLKLNVELDETPRDRARLADYYVEREDWPAAVEQFQRAVTLETESTAPDLRHWVTLLTRLAKAHVQLDQLDLAEARLLEALGVRDAHLGSRHPYLAFTLRELGSFYADQERYADAETHLLRAKELNEAAWGHTADRCSCVTDDLLEQVQKALAGIVEVEPAEARTAAQAEPAQARKIDPLERIDERLRELEKSGRIDAAIEQALQGLSLRGSRWGESSNEYAQGLERLADVYRRGRRSEQSLATLEQALALREELWGYDDPRLASLLHELGTVTRTLQQHPTSERFFLRENDLRQRLGQNLRSARLLESLGHQNRRTDQPDRAEYFYAWAAEVWTDMAGPEAPETARLAAALARVQMDQAKYVEAETLLLQALETERAKRYLDAGTRILLLQPLKTLLQKTDRAEEAQAVEARIKELRRSA